MNTIISSSVGPRIAHRFLSHGVQCADELGQGEGKTEADPITGHCEM